MTPLLRKFLGQNWLLTALVGVLLVFGVHAVRLAGEGNPSPSIEFAYRDQINWILIGLAVYFIVLMIDYRWLKWACGPGMFVGVGMLLYSLVWGKVINDTQGWIDLGFISFQPSQFALGAAIITTSCALGELRKVHPFFKQPFVNMGLVALLMGVPCLLVILQGDIGTALIWLPVAGALCLIGNIPFRHLALAGLAALTILPLFYYFVLDDNRRSRVEVFLDIQKGNEIDIQGRGYAYHYLPMAVGSGGWNGFRADPMNISPDSYSYNPDNASENLADQKFSVHSQGLIPRKTAHTDFVFGVVAGHYGFRGSAMLILGFALLVLICVHIAYFSRDQTGRLIVVGTAALLMAHTFQNIGMTILLMPITGIPLPFLSYGGTFMVTILGLIGVVQSVWIHRHIDPQRERAEKAVKITQSRLLPI